jgi:hypothetical protein
VCAALPPVVELEIKLLFVEGEERPFVASDRPNRRPSATRSAFQATGAGQEPRSNS